MYSRYSNVVTATIFENNLNKKFFIIKRQTRRMYLDTIYVHMYLHTLF